MNKSHRDIKDSDTFDENKFLDEYASRPKELYVIKPEKKKGSWIEEFLLDRVFGFIIRAVELNVHTQPENGKLFLFVVVKIARRKLLDERIKLI